MSQNLKPQEKIRMAAVIPEIRNQDLPMQRGSVAVQKRVGFRSRLRPRLHLLFAVWPKRSLLSRRLSFVICERRKGPPCAAVVEIDHLKTFHGSLLSIIKAQNPFQSPLLELPHPQAETLIIPLCCARLFHALAFPSSLSLKCLLSLAPH